VGKKEKNCSPLDEADACLGEQWDFVALREEVEATAGDTVEHRGRFLGPEEVEVQPPLEVQRDDIVPELAEGFSDRLRELGPPRGVLVPLRAHVVTSRRPWVYCSRCGNRRRGDVQGSS
jgi:hypothetical protein